ncbi:hybrid non-ribosomal peptide synthetase/type I polyketide synthase [Tunturibacter empetritectus]|uniref:Amino acid adenylation domain-containing protein n=1 Tax=Tunturiibacter empetritectus TaxID=3069691 RepID=A0A7W8IFW9_9BACT|nr:non-ribosomal peptide synthetase/type I polyketide synthase [Edaphobacter lichenicola]MBB5315458.1 amino acid adenylation domain-containing protein [Edaphobacter lichenicola]
MSERLNQETRRTDADAGDEQMLDCVAIIGMSGRFPGAPDVETFWQNIAAGKVTISHFSPSELEARNSAGLEYGSDYVAARGVLDDPGMFDAEFFGISPRDAESMDPQHRIFLETCWNTLEDAGYDQSTYAGQIGLFGGCSLNTYLLANLCRDRAFIDEVTGNYQVGEFRSFMGNDKDFLTTRVAYKLNLRGPCISVASACATSLVAVAQASQSLLNYQCDMALAGGVSVTFPQRRGHLYSEGSIGSKDGFCRPFDAAATGTVFSHGAGALLLKRLEDAIADRDHITAVIRGFGVNNDGSMKAGYMAPGVDGQSGVIAAAQAMSGVDARTITYIEAHGTATPLGDPIEVAALTKAFRLNTAASGFCAIGTAKANVGHLDAAAGVAGVIKTALSLKKATLPPLANFESANPNIDFEDSPFYVNRELSPWRSDGPRRAGVSAFGVGGVNAHVVLEEAPALQPLAATLRSAQLLCVSARSQSALPVAIGNLARYIKEHPEVPLEDVGYTLAVGRKAFDHRAAFVFAGAEDAIAKLSSAKPEANRVVPAKRPEVVFLFPGQGAQFAGMGSSLYKSEPLYRREVEECCEILRPLLGLDLREILFPVDVATPEAAERIQQTQFAQTGIFVTEFAMAKLWQAWGIEPRASAGHSIGEYVAAVLAGVMSREDALRLVSIRGRMMQEMPRGAMVGVRLSESELQPYLAADISIAALNAPKLSVLAGPLEAVERLEKRLTADGALFRRLRTSHAFHSSMMDPMLAGFEAEVAKVTLHRPVRPYVSSFTGTWIEPEQATSPRFWADQVRNPVRFADALKTLMSTPQILLEVGPGNTLATLARQQPNSSTAVIVSSLAQRDEQSPVEAGSLQEALGQLWLAGATPDWTKVYAEERRQRVSLPTYPFERKLYWVEPPPFTVGSQPIESPIISRAEMLDIERGGEVIPAAMEPLKEAPMQERKLRLQPIVSEVFTQLSGIEVTPDQVDHQFLELGLDSLFLTQATQGIQKKFGVKLTFRQIMEQYSTIASLSGYLDSVLPPDAFPAAVQVQAAPVQMVATPSSVSAPVANFSGSASSAPAGSAAERLFSEQMAMMSKVFEQQMAALRATTGLPAAVSSAASAAVTAATPGVATAASSSSAAPASTGETAEVKHGSYRPLQPRVQQDLDSDQQQYLDALIAKYEKKTPGSKRLTDKARVHLADPRAVAGFRPQWKEMVYPLVTERAKGSRIWDVDGNEYIDIVNGYGAIMFGHSPQFVLDAVHKQIEEGVAIGPQSPLAGEVAAQICELTGNDRVTFCNTGSEAVMAAIRVARTVTGRDRIIYFAGDYHGTFDEVLVRNTPRGTVPLAPGIPIANTGNVVVLEYGADASLEYIRKNASEIAAVLIEPVQTRNPGLQPIAFIKTVRQITEQAEIALIIDEVVTGFRLAPGGVQETFGVRADLATYGKVIGGGYPIGVLSGKAQFMDALDGGAWQYGDASIPEVGVTFFAGTFVRHPQALAAARAVLNHLKAAGPQLQLDLNRKTAEMATRLDNFFVERGVPSRINHFASWFYFTFHGDARLGSLLYYAMREKGIHIQEGYPCFLTTAHTDADLQTVEDVFRETVEEMQSSNALPSHGEHQSHAVVAPVSAMHPAALKDSPVKVPITEAQREIYFAAALGDEMNCAFNESVTLRLRGNVDERALKQALESVFARHDALRSTISEDGESIMIAPAFHGAVEQVDLSSAADASREQTVHEAIEREGRIPFSLTEGPLARATIFKMSADETVLLFTGHHIVLDGWSVNQLFEEISKFYSAKGSASEKLLPLLPFSSYAVQEQTRQTSGEFADNEAYWVNKFSGLAPVLDLPTDRPRPVNKTYHGATLKGSLGPALYTDLKGASARLGCTLYVTLLSGFQLLLHRLTRQPEVVVGISTAGQALFQNASLVGHCVHFLPMLSQLTEAETAKSHLAATRNVLFDAFDHQEFTYGSLLHKLSIPRDAGRLPLIEVQFNLEKIGARIGFDGLSAEIKANPKQFVNTDMFLNVIETEDDLKFDCDFNTDLFDEETVRRWMHQYANLLSSVVRDATLRVDELELLDEKDQREIVEGWNRTEVEFGREFVPIHRIAELRAQKQADQVVVECGSKRWTGRELDQYSNRVAHRLQQEGLKAGDLVGLCVERSVEMLGALLGVLKAGGAYVPLDPRHPKDRLEMVLEDAGAALLLVGGSFSTAQPGFKTSAKVVVLDTKIAEESDAPLEVPAAADSLAYVIYTSGTTGRPKGVAVEQGALMNLLQSMEREPGLNRADVLVAVTTLAFDIAGLELLLPLLTGARLVIANEEEVADGYLLLQLLQRSKATVLQATPGTWRMLIDAGWSRELPLKVLCGGEALPRDLADQLVERSEQVWNVYGPTETTIWSSATRVTAGTGPLLIGPPIANTQFYVLDHRLHPVPVGVVGELYIGGTGLARGYWKRPDLTAERFLPNPFAKGRVYKTGDLGRWHVNAEGQGQVELLGRTDFQVKIRGYRIELGEIEVALNRHPAVREAVVVAHTSKSAGAAITRLVAYVDAGNSAEHATALTADLLTMLAGTLPEYMIPAAILPLPQLPRSPNGKIDRKRLPDAETFLKAGLHSAQRPFTAPATAEQKKLAEIWAEVLMLDRVSITDSIFELGADSLLIFRIAARSQKEGLNVTAAQIFKHRTILALSDRLGEQAETRSNTIKAAPRITVAPRKTYRGESGTRG